MTNEIKQRIEQIQNGEIPEGYRYTNVGISPKDWDYGCLGDVLYNVKREVPKPTQPYWRIGIRSHAKGTFHEYVKDPENVSMTELYIVKENDLILNITFAWEHAVALAEKKDDGLLVSHRFPTYVFKDGQNPVFFKSIAMQERFKEMLGHISPGGAGRNRVMSRTDFLKLNCVIPPTEEQNKIAAILMQYDKVIELHNRMIEQLRMLKKVCLRKMFPEKGESFPEWRFPQYTDAWEQRKLSECAGFRRGSFPQPYGNREWYDGEGAMPFVQVADVSDDLKLVNDTKQKISKLAQPMSVFAEKGSVLVTLQGSIGRVAITQYEAFVDRTVLIFDNYNQNICKTFWAYIIKEKFIEEAKKAPGGTIKKITKEVLSNFDLILPNYDEQQHIGNFFSNLDNLITLHQRELQEHEERKKVLMQLLLTGIVRVKK